MRGESIVSRRTMLRRALAVGAAVFLVIGTAPVQRPIASAATPATDGVPKPPGLRAGLPWGPGKTHYIDSDYGKLLHINGKPGYSQDNYALDFVGNWEPNEPIYPIADGTLLFAGSLLPVSYGTVVLVQHLVRVGDKDVAYESLYAHLSSVADYLKDAPTGTQVFADRPLGAVGNSGCDTWTPACPVHLHFALYKGAQADSTGYRGPHDGQAVVPEPLIGEGVYENFAWFKGPLTATKLDAAASNDSLPGGVWTAGATKSGSLLGPGAGVRFQAHVSSPHAIKEVHFTAGYADWAITSGTAFDSPPFPSGSSANRNLAIWRIVLVCRPGDSCWAPTPSRGPNDADVSFTWTPWADQWLASPVAWLPTATSAAPTTPANQKVCISFDVYDTSGATNLAPNGMQCSATTLFNLASRRAPSLLATSYASPLLASTGDDGSRLVTLSATPPPVDLVFAIDTTGSMVPYIDAVKAAATSITTSVLNSGNARIGVVDYKDLYESCPGDGYASRVDLPFSTNSTAIVASINSLNPIDGQGCDTPESVYSGVMTAIGFPWRAGVSKAIIVMGDAPPHDPEPVTGYTLQSVVNAANAVDPASIYAIDLKGGGGTYFPDLASQTGGEDLSAASPTDAVDAILSAITTIIETPPSPPSAGSLPCTPANNCFFNTPAPSPSPSPTPTPTPTPAVLPSLSIGSTTALGANPTSGYSTKSLKVQAKGKYVSWKFTGGAALAGQRVTILTSTAAGRLWGPWKPLTVRVADANGSVTFWWKSAKAASVSIRVEWMGNDKYGASLSPARGVTWK